MRPLADYWRIPFRGALNILREPIYLFLAVGFTLFLLNGLLNGSLRDHGDSTINISQGRVQQIAESYQLLAGRPPSQQELQALVDDFVSEEIAYREAIALGLDVDDTIIRRRLGQKLKFLVEDADASEPPSQDQLAAWLQSHQADYQLPARFAFTHILASADTRGDQAQSDAQAFLEALKSGSDPADMGDTSMLPTTLFLTSEQGVSALFGPAFADSLFASTQDEWFGPITSPLGAHIVRVTSREPGRVPDLTEIENILRSDWIDARRTSNREEYLRDLRQRYQVNINWPETDIKPSNN